MDSFGNRPTEPEVNPTLTVIVIDADPQSLAFVSSALKRTGIEVLTASDPAAGLEVLRRHRAQVALLDTMLPKVSGLEVMDRILEADPGVNVILMGPQYSAESALAAIRLGACDYVGKPLPLERLRERLNGLLEEARRGERRRRLADETIRAFNFEGIVGQGPLMREICAEISRIAPHFRTVLITGPSGAGKRLAAKALHALSPAATGPFVVCACPALEDQQADNELFGDVRAGLFESAHGGTLFLDGIGDLPLATQARLSRAIQTQEVQRPGSGPVRRVNVRVIAAAHRDPRTLVHAKPFREDLFARLAAARIQLPPLVDRREDLPLLIHHFVGQFSRKNNKSLMGLTRRAETAVFRHTWPGNVRELESALGQACLKTDSAWADLHHLPPALGNGGVAMVPLREMERSHTLRVLESFDGDKVRAAKTLGISRATLYRLLAQTRTLDA